MINCNFFKKTTLDMLFDPSEKWKFVNVLSLLFIFLTFVFDYCFFVINFPDKNRDILVGIANIINSGGIITILNYFFGSSKSSDGKDRVITSLVNNGQNGNVNSNGNDPGTITVTPTNPPSTIEVKTTPIDTGDILTTTTTVMDLDSE